VENNMQENNIPGLPYKPTYRISEIARYYSRTTRTVYEWIKLGYLETIKTPCGGRMITRESLENAGIKKKGEV